MMIYELWHDAIRQRPSSTSNQLEYFYIYIAITLNNKSLTIFDWKQIDCGVEIIPIHQDFECNIQRAQKNIFIKMIWIAIEN